MPQGHRKELCGHSELFYQSANQEVVFQKVNSSSNGSAEGISMYQPKQCKDWKVYGQNELCLCGNQIDRKPTSNATHLLVSPWKRQLASFLIN